MSSKQSAEHDSSTKQRWKLCSLRDTRILCPYLVRNGLGWWLTIFLSFAHQVMSFGAKEDLQSARRDFHKQLLQIAESPPDGLSSELVMERL